MGTPAYMAPEQALSAAGVTEKADIYALGIILYEMLAGTAPFMAPSLASMLMLHLQAEARPVRELTPEVPETLARLVARMMAKAPTERPSAREVANAVEALSMPAALLASSAAPAPVPAPAPASVSAGPLILASTPGLSSGPTLSAPTPSLAQPAIPTPLPPLALPPISTPAPTVPLQLPPRQVVQGIAFVHRGTSAITVDNWAYIDHPASNGDPMSQLYLTASWNPGGIGGTYNNHHTGVWYVSNGRWSVYNEDRITMPPTAAFNVLITKMGFIHRAIPSNIVNNWTLLDHPATNGRPDALLIVTANWNPGGIGGTYNNHALGVWYTEGRWSIYNQDRKPMPVNAAFNVLVSEQTFLHRVSASNLVGVNGTGIEHPAARNPNAVVLVTSNWNPGGLGGLYHDHALGVYYCQDRWVIFNQDMTPMPVGAAFNVLIAS